MLAQGIQSSAAFADGIVYFACRDSKFYALDVATGKQIWAFSNKGSWVIASPAVSDGKVYCATPDAGRIESPVQKLPEKQKALFAVRQAGPSSF